MFHKLLSTVLRNRTGQDDFYYVVITDVKDAFGSVNYLQMKKILKYYTAERPTYERIFLTGGTLLLL